MKNDENKDEYENEENDDDDDDDREFFNFSNIVRTWPSIRIPETITKEYSSLITSSSIQA
jgi:hypothetical protein